MTRVKVVNVSNSINAPVTGTSVLKPQAEVGNQKSKVRVLKMVRRKNNNLDYIKKFNSNRYETHNALDACGCTGNGSC